jgi:hypothetical protein
VVPALLVLLLASRAFDHRWPITEHARAYRYNAALFLLLLFAIWRSSPTSPTMRAATRSRTCRS